MTQLCFVSARGGNYFMTELLSAVAHGAAAGGAEVTMAVDDFPDLGPSTAYVFVPHEYMVCASPSDRPTREQLRRTVALSVEQPGTPRFELAARVAAGAGAVLDINACGLREYRRRGVAAERFRLGYLPYWDAWSGSETAERTIDVLHMGSYANRRERLLSAYARDLWRHRSKLLMPPEGAPNLLVGDAKRKVLASARILLNVHREDVPYFEWVRALEAICNGAVLVSEHSTGHEPLVPGRHFVTGDAESLSLLADELLGDEARLRTMRQDTYAFVRSELPVAPALELLFGLAERCSGRISLGRAVAGGLRDRRTALGERTARLTARREAPLRTRGRPQPPDPLRPDPIRARMKRLALEQVELRRMVADQRERGLGGDPEAVHSRSRTPTYDLAAPRVSVCIPVYNHGEEAVQALNSVAACQACEFEVLILDDASTDGSAEAVRSYLDEHWWLPCKLLERAVNRGLGAARNVLMERARAEYVFMCDADNTVYPTALGRLVEALDANPDAVFAYSMLEKFGPEEPGGLLSALPWDPERLRVNNYIDAMSMLRCRQVLELGGFTEDLQLYGWEDFDLWCRLAEAGQHGVMVPEVLSRYRVAEASMISTTNIDVSEAWAAIRQRYPGMRSPSAKAPDEAWAI